MIRHIFKLIWNKKGSNALMILEIFLSFLVLFFALAYMFFNFDRINTPLGFDTVDQWMIGLDDVYKMDSLDAANVINNLKRDLLDEDNIENVTFCNYAAPFINSQSRTTNDANGFEIHTLIVNADHNFAKTVNANIVEGRWFTEEDLTATIPKIILNQSFVDEFFEGKSMIDSTFLFDDPVQVIGVVDQYRYQGEFSEVEPLVFLPLHETELTSFVILDMKKGTPASYEETLSNLIKRSMNKSGSTIVNLEKMRKEDSQESWLMLLAILFTCGFLCLNVALGLFGVLWYSISKRKSEVGLRQALGATGTNITSQFILEILVLTFFALIIGIFFAIQIPILDVTEYEDSLFYKAIIYASLIILLLVGVCSLFPSLQAAKITPANSLHEE